ncbi:MAG: MG2 domain-containing protein [Deltaproteobacteria bacterium]|nr:MG2 domain-containing protein [Deltaproteobacteria bacterium]
MKYQTRMGIFWAVVLFSFFIGNHALAGGAAEVKSFSPEGVVKGVRQATATFSEPMVPFGDPRLADPFTVQCPGKGQGRWIDSRTWSYDFAADLPGGTECEFRLQDGVKALSGANVSGRKDFRFSTGGPAVARSVPYEGNERIDERQIFVLYLDAAPREASLTGNVYFSVAGVKERIGITIVAGNERRKILKAINYKGDERLVVLVQARQAFPDTAVVKLIWGRGVASASGVATEKDQVLSFRTREPFRAEFSCTREKADRNCIPILPVGLRFSAPIPVKLAEQIVITGPKEKKWPGKISDSDRRRGIVSYLSFPGPFPEKSKLTLRLPGEIKDDAGRILSNADKFPLPVTMDAYPPLAKFAARFGIIEAKGDRLLPVTIRNIERQLQGRLLKVDEKAPTPLVEAEEGTGEGAEQGAGSAPTGEKTGAGAGAVSGAAQAATPGSPAFTARLTGKMQRIGVDQDIKVIEWLRKIAAAEREAPILGRQAPSLNFPERKQEKAFEVVGIPLPGPGFYIVEMESRILGAQLLTQPAPLYIPAAALTTDMAAHFKWGREYSLVWVTSLEKGTPVAGAAVVIRDCKGKALWQGKTDRTGVAMIKTRLPNPDDLSQCSGKVNYRESPHALSNLNGGLFVFARSGGDMTFTHSSWDEGIEPWRFQLPTGGYSGEEGIVAHTILDRPLFRAGETAHMKHILRTHTSGGFALLPMGKRPDFLTIQHLGSDQTYRLPLRWHANGSAETDWKIPENARLGTYELTLVKSKSPQDKTSVDERRWRSGSFRMEEFRVPLMKDVIQVPATPLVNVRETPLDLSVSYLSGGGASLLPIRLRAEVQPKTITYKDYEDFSFTGGPLREGIFTVSGRDDLDEGQDAVAAEEAESPAASGKPFKLPTQELKLDNQGVLRAELRGLPQVPTARDIHVEMEFKDPNGEIQTAAARIPLYPSRLIVGIRPDSWTAAQDNLNYKVVVVDLQGKPAPNVEATVDLYRQQTYSHRVRLVGGFYAYKNTREVKKIGRHCQGRTDAMGLLTCQGPSTVSGSVILRAEVRDESGLASAANYDLWIAGKDDWWFEGGNDDRIDVLPEKKKYEPGDKAKFQVRMPFREATALITVEREDILDVYTKRLSGKSPMVEIPIKKHYAPNVFVSVLVVRGRVGDARPTATFDPGKPAYKLGVTEIRVGGQAHQLDVQVVPERTVYKVRDTMNVRIKVKGPAGRPLPKGGEVVIAAVDKGLLQLTPNDSWHLLTAMMQRRDYEVRTATAQAMVVGKRHFGQKSLSHGGGGGRQFTRELFDTLLFWQGRLPLDAQGKATVRIPLNDSLTGFRIVAVATAGTGLFGTGEADIQTTQDLMILSGLPPLVREGDRYRAIFTVRNASDHEMRIEGRLTVRGAKEAQEQEARQEMLPPGAARELAWWITVPHDVASGLEYEATVKEQGGGSGNDRLKVVQKVTPAVPVRTVQAVLTQVRTPASVPIEKPADAEAGRGGISVQVKPVLAASLTGVRDYMDHYAYTCLEQKVSRAVALKNKALWQATMAQLPSYIDSDGLLKYFPVMRQGSDSLTAYVLAVAAEGGCEIPAYLRDRMTAGLRQFVEGRVIRYGALATADLAIRKLSALEAMSRYGQADTKLLTSIPLDPNLWPTSALLDWINILQRQTDIPQREEKLKEGQQILRARMNLQGTRMTFSTERMDQLWWLMASSDSNAVRSLLTLMNQEAWRNDLPRLAAGALGRMRQGHWDTTTANAWGVLAMDKFSARYEKTPVGGTTTAALNSKTRSLDWQKAPAGGTLTFNWPAGKETLQVTHSGAGAPWATIGATAALRLTKPFSSGFHVMRTVTKLVDNSDTFNVSTGTVGKGRGAAHASADSGKNGGTHPPIPSENKGSATKFNVGDIVRVRLDMEAQSDMTWVVLNDPIPAGASILRTGLGGDSLLLAAGEKTRGFAQEAFTERSQEAFRVYYEYVPKGKWSTEYTLRLNNEGVFQMPPSRLEALYAPEMFGETPIRPLTVTGKKQP